MTHDSDHGISAILIIFWEGSVPAPPQAPPQQGPAELLTNTDPNLLPLTFYHFILSHGVMSNVLDGTKVHAP